MELRIIQLYQKKSLEVMKMSIMIWHNGRYYNNASREHKRKLQGAFMDEIKKAKWEKQIFDASSLFKDVQTNQEFVRKVTRVNVLQKVFANLVDKEEDVIFDCEIFDGNEAWLGHDDVEYRYFTRKSSKNIGVGYTIVDLLCALQPDSDVNSPYCFWKTRTELAELLNVSYKASVWEKVEEEKYDTNLEILQIMRLKEFSSKYPYISLELKEHIEVLQMMFETGKRFINLKKKDIYGNSRFVFYPNKYDLSTKKFYNFIRVLKNMNLVFVEKREDTYFDKKRDEDVTKNLTFYSFPRYSEELFGKIEERLMQQDGIRRIR